MLKRVVKAFPIAAAFLLGSLVSPTLTTLRAQGKVGGLHKTVPKDWGSLRAVSDQYVAFEAANGTIRLASIQSGLTQAIEIGRR